MNYRDCLLIGFMTFTIISGLAADDTAAEMNNLEFSIYLPDTDSGAIPGVTNQFDVEPVWSSVNPIPREPILDWRDVGGVNYISDVEDQFNTGLCWAFSSSHQLESMIRIANYPEPFVLDFSEDAIGDCTYPGGSVAGGNVWKCGSHFSAGGPVLESCQSWTAGQNNCLPCPQQDYRMRKMAIVAQTAEDIKAALVNGPVACSMHTMHTAENFDVYNGSFVLNDDGQGTQDINHQVLIVGYHEGSGDPGYLDGNYWICQNSWGSNWGDNGFFYITYGAANIGSGAAQYLEWEPSLESQDKDILYDDENGGWGIAYTPPLDVLYACMKLTPESDGEILEVQWANAGNKFDWEIRIFDIMQGDTPGDQLGATLSGANETHGGYLSASFPEPIPAIAGDPVFVCVRLHNPGNYIHPICSQCPYDDNAYFAVDGIMGPYQTNRSAGIPYDWSIRLITRNTTTPPTATPTATATPALTLGVDLQLSQAEFHPGDDFLLEAYLNNPGPEIWENCCFAVLLDVYSQFFWHPGWTEDFECEPLLFAIGSDRREILRFPWPEVDGTASGILFYGAVLNPEYSGIIGALDMTSFGWSP